jgi:hypothetical protein
MSAVVELLYVYTFTLAEHLHRYTSRYRSMCEIVSVFVLSEILFLPIQRRFTYIPGAAASVARIFRAIDNAPSSNFVEIIDALFIGTPISRSKVTPAAKRMLMIWS